LIPLGFFSGLISSWANGISSGPQFLICLPGIIFGVALSLFFSPDVFFAERKRIKALGALIGFVAVSTAAWLAAFFGAMALMFAGSSNGAPPWMYAGIFIGGCIGALILSLGLALLHRFSTPKEVLILTITGGLLGVVSFLPGLNIYFLFPIWQAGMAAEIAYFYKVSLS
jgi:hypothetical protein